MNRTPARGAKTMYYRCFPKLDIPDNTTTASSIPKTCELYNATTLVGGFVKHGCIYSAVVAVFAKIKIGSSNLGGTGGKGVLLTVISRITVAGLQSAIRNPITWCFFSEYVTSIGTNLLGKAMDKSSLPRVLSLTDPANGNTVLRTQRWRRSVRPRK